MLVTKQFTFDSAHFLPHYHGKCEKLHGHTYTLHITVKADIDQKSGIAFDFTELKNIVKQEILSVLDHAMLNDIIPIPSAENIAVWIWGKLQTKLPLYEIKVWETETSFVTYRGE